MKSIKIKELTFNSMTQEVECFGALYTGSLSIESQVTICYSTLNKIMNKIASLWPSEDIWQWLESRENLAGTFYCIRFPEPYQLHLDLLDFQSWFNDKPRKISA